MAKSPLSRNDVIPHLAEVFREFGFEGTTLSVITRHTGLGKGSLYNFFPGGKEEMAEAVLEHINAWFQNKVFDPLENSHSPHDGLIEMLANVETYFESGQRICIVGMFALGESRDRFREQIQGFFESWRTAMVKTLRRAGLSKSNAVNLTVDALAAIQGGLVLARASDDCNLFRGRLARLKLNIRCEIERQLC